MSIRPLSLACSELVLYHFLNACTLASLIALSHTSFFFRTMVKTLHRIRLCAVVEQFVGRENVHRFFEVLEVTDSAVGGSTLLRVLTPPTSPSGYDWMPSNLNIYVPLGNISPWNAFFAEIKLDISSRQPGIAFPYKSVTNSHTQYYSRVSAHLILLSESINASVITPAVAASTTLAMCIATCSTTVVLYPELVDRGRAHSGWNSPTVAACIKLQDRDFRHSVSTISWKDACGWNCPVLWRRVQCLRGVGVFCWGGIDNKMRDNGSVGIPFTDVSMKWRLDDKCWNVNCPWSAVRSVA
ncbi:hypothetical protein MVEN_00121600 [Mycena venus]|uniref:Uncharacterized protein n=1 Tax=Mycena venus TaxID=2733690 RepID=A0A8H6Z4U0_9AGAR|nr:hypothetical protein MVEN_00121600 [Mycena venus]